MNTSARFLVAILTLAFMAVRSPAQSETDTLPQLTAGLELLDRAAEIRTEKPLVAKRLASDAAGLIDAALAPEQQRSPFAQRALGNAHLIADELGYAVLAYRRALDADPTDRQAAASIEHARSLIDTRAPDTTGPAWGGLLERARAALPRQTAFMTATGAFTVACLTLAVALQLRRGTPSRRAMGIAAPILLVLALIPATTLAADAWLGHRTDAAAVVIAAADARTGPDADIYPTVFETPVPAGTELLIQDTRPGWVFARIGSVEGWLPETTIQRIRPPSEAPAY